MQNNFDIICRSMRRIGILAAGEHPNEIELNDALDTLKAIYTRLISEGSLGQLRDVIATDARHIADEFTRVYTHSPEICLIELPEIVSDCGKDRPPHDKAVIAIADRLHPHAMTSYVFDGDLKQWLPIETMTLTSTAPFAARDANGLSATLAVELADEYGQPVGDLTRFSAIRFHNNIINDWSRPDTINPKPENYF